MENYPILVHQSMHVCNATWIVVELFFYVSMINPGTSTGGGFKGTFEENGHAQRNMQNVEWIDVSIYSTKNN